MKTMQDWLDAYAVSHQNKTNKAIHFICVPLIVFSLVGLLMSIPNDILKNISGLNSDTIANWAVVTLVPILFFYLRLSVKMGVLITLFLFLCVFGNAQLSAYFPLWQSSLAIFVLAWIGQFYGHKIEGAKPSFFDDLKFLLIGPAWILDDIFFKNK
ncbi:MAG: DUF962 domain-containing protein [Flavobacteriaceae bacterium]